MATYTFIIKCVIARSKGEALSRSKNGFTITNAKASRRINIRWVISHWKGMQHANQNLQTNADLKGTFASFTGNMNIDSLVIKFNPLFCFGW